MMSPLRTAALKPMHISPDRASISVWMKLGRCGLMFVQVLCHAVSAQVRQGRRII